MTSICLVVCSSAHPCPSREAVRASECFGFVGLFMLINYMYTVYIRRTRCRNAPCTWKGPVCGGYSFQWVFILQSWTNPKKALSLAELLMPQAIIFTQRTTLNPIPMSDSFFSSSSVSHNKCSIPPI